MNSGMLKIDNTLLEEVGLGVLPVQVKNQLLQTIYETLESRVGTRLADQMSDEQLDEFEKFIDGDTTFSQQWLTTNTPGYEQTEAFQKHMEGQVNPSTGEKIPGVVQEFAALKWLEKNFPDYKKVVAEELEKLKGEIRRDASHIIASVQAQAPEPQS